MGREITLPKTGETTWTNRETGVTIELVCRDGSTWYDVRQPEQSSTGYLVVKRSHRFGEALAFAKNHAVPGMRDRITAAKVEALTIEATFSIREAERAIQIARVTGGLCAGDHLDQDVASYVAEAASALGRGDYAVAAAFAGVAKSEAERAVRQRDRQFRVFVDQVRDFRQATGCGLHSGMGQAKDYCHALANVIEARRQGHPDWYEVADAAYLSASYSRARSTRSHEAAMIEGRAQVAADLRAGGVPAGEPTPSRVTEYQPFSSGRRVAEMLVDLASGTVPTPPGFRVERVDADRFRVTNEESPECGVRYGTGAGTATCRRPVGHPSMAEDRIGHAPVKFPPGTREYAQYAADLRSALDDWVND